MSIFMRLSILMFLQFFIWGAWYLTVSLYMIENVIEAGNIGQAYWAYTAVPIAAIISPFFTGLFADRFFNTEKVLAVLFIGAGLSMLALKFFIDDVFIFNSLILLHALFFMPTLGLTASLSFCHLPGGNKQFPLVRLWGTLGWIVAGLVLAFIVTPLVKQEAGKTLYQFYLGGGAAILLGLFCLSLPKTEAPKRGEKIDLKTLLFFDAWGQLRNRSFFVFIVCSFLVCIPLAAYYASLQQQMDAMGMKNITFWKNIGTWIEAGMMFAMPFLFRKLGIKKMIAIGIAAWIIRYILFILGATPEGTMLVILGIALHGICYDFFFVTGQVYVDQSTPKSIRGQAQSMNIFFTQGIGLFIGNWINIKLR